MPIGDYAKQTGNPRLLEMYWKATGGMQGDLHNQSDMRGYEKFSRVIGVSWGIAGQVDQQSGRRSGHRHLEPLVITKQIDKSTPSLLQAMIQNENIKESEFAYVDVLGHGTSQGKTGRILTIKTQNGSISKIEGGTTAEGMMIETIHLYFDKIMWRHDVATTEASDERIGNVG